ncbi:glycerophosphoryl diester phosphodiesterase [Streptosporangium subroseum]|uniref:Glycerophosphoryl diester phosphodiesterase n=1 Tax=Streptosporangium subroseum TaxID=106412 RepID=A0A239KUQ5_9ACTN|nr:glycerophosphodiester phosphodiesterase [Streptosporangium subroseum]SNT21795.1 glycerophosphoryl diester phosphodiesterase [Streptosporangium subroseum]
MRRPGKARSVRPLVRWAREAAKISLLSALTLGGVGEAHGLALPAPSTCSTPGVVSHRGYRAGGVENTIKAFDRALDAGSEQIEFDVHFTKDHHPVLMHDALVDRTTTGTGRVSDMTLARFRELRTTDAQRPPTLSAALELARGRAEEVLVELKEVPDAQDLRSLKRDYRRFDAYTWASLMSFSRPALEAVASIPARKGLLATTAPPLALAGKFDFVVVRYDRLTEALTREYLDDDVAVYAWTPNDRSAWERLAGYGVDRVITNETSAYLAWARERCDP